MSGLKRGKGWANKYWVEVIRQDMELRIRVEG